MKSVEIDIPQGSDLPANITAERSVIGAILGNNEVYDLVCDILKPKHFFNPAHEALYHTICRRIEAGQTADSVTLMREVESSDALSCVGGSEYVIDLMTSFVRGAKVVDYAKEVIDCWIRRQLIRIGLSVVNSSFANTGFDQLAEAERRIGSLADGSAGEDSLATVAEAVAAAIEEGAKARKGQGTVSTGLPLLDEMIIGLRPGSLYIIGGRPGMGKTSLARGFAVNAAAGIRLDDFGQRVDDPSSGVLTVFFSMEEDVPEFGAGIAAQLSGISIQQVLSGTYDNHGASDVVAVQHRLAKTPLIIDRTPSIGLARMRSTLRRIKRKYKRPIGLIVVDYLQLMADPPGQREKRLAVGENANGLKAISKEEKCAVIALSQLKRIEGRADNRPTMQDLRESGEIEAAADVIMFPYRPAYYALQERPSRDMGEPQNAYDERLSEWQANYEQIENFAELLIPKIRRGRSPRVLNLNFDGTRTRFTQVGGAY